MKYTNKFGLPQEIVAAITKDRYTNEEDKPSDYSVTSLINPIQQTILKKRHKDDLKIQDVTELTWSFFGSIAHAQIEEAWHASMGSKIEERLYTTYKDITVSGKFDCYHDGEIKDWKFTKVYKITKSDFSDWEIQLNCYAYLCVLAGYPVNKLTIYAFLRDWAKGNAYKKGYPECEWQVIDIPLWDSAKQKKYIEDRIDELIWANSLDDSKLLEVFPCSSRDMWQDTIGYAVIKQDAKRATKCFDNEEDAKVYLEQKNDKSLSIVHRQSTRKRCFDHCPVSHHCQQHKALLLAEGTTETIF